MKFSKPWIYMPTPDGETLIPVLDLRIRAENGSLVRETFILDSGADFSIAPRGLCKRLGIPWNSGERMRIQGISPRKECVVTGMLHHIEVYIREASVRVTLPFCFTAGDAPFLLGREGFLDVFRVQLDKKSGITVFELS